MFYLFIIVSSPLFPNRQLSTASPDEQRHTADVSHVGSERRGHRGLGLRQRDPHIRSSQGPAVIGPIATHAHPVAAVTRRSVFRERQGQAAVPLLAARGSFQD